MRHKNHWFSLKLFWETFRQLRLPGIVGTILLSIAAALIPLGTARSLQASAQTAAPSFTGLWMHPALLAVMYLFVPMMALLAFRFLDRRNESDYFLSAPFSRQCLYISRFCAVLAWTVVLIAVSSVVSLLCFRWFCSVAILNMESFRLFLFNIFASSVFVTGAFCIAMTLTGTPFNNFVAALLIIFVPRLMIYSVTDVISEIPYILSRSLPFVLDGSWNSFTYPLFQFFNIYSTKDSSILQTTAPAVYTLCVGLVYAAIGGILFHFRRSEIAETPAANKTVQAVFRITLALMFTLPFCNEVSRTIESNRGIDSACLLWILAAVIAYFLYELAVTKKLSALRKAVPGLLIVLALNLLTICSMKAICTSEKNFLPEANEITSVNFLEKTDLFDSWSPYEDYFGAKTAEVTIEDEVINEILSRNLKQITAMRNEYIQKGFGPSWTYDYAESYPYCQVFRINCNGTSKLRKIAMNQEDWNTLTERLQQNSAFQAAYRDLPEWGSNGLSILYAPFSDESLSDIYNTLRQEVKEIDFKQWYNAIGNSSSNPLLDFFSISAPVGTQNTKVTIMLDPTLLPETCKAYARTCNESSTIIEPLMESTISDDGKLEFDGETVYCSIRFFNYDSDFYFNFSNSYSPADNCEALKTLQQLIRETKDAELDVTKPFAEISFSSQYLYLPLPEGEICEALLDLANINKHN